MADDRKKSPWYKAWKAIFKVSLYYFLALILGLFAGTLFGGGNDFLAPFFLLSLLFFPLLLISFVALFIMRENDRERDRIRKYREEMKNGNGDNAGDDSA